MEDLAGRGGLHDLHIGVSRQLHEALQTRRAVLRPLPFVAVRQHEGQAIDPAPFDFAGCDELVNHHLRAVGKVAELCFPDHQGVGVVGGVAVFKTEHRFFRQDGVDHGKRCLAVGGVLQGHVIALVPAFAVLVVDHRMAVREGAAPTVFARQADRVAAGHQRRKSHVLAHAPVHWQFAATHGGAVVIDLFHQLMGRHGGRDRGNPLSQALPLAQRQSGVGGIGPFFAQEGLPVDREFVLEVGQHRVFFVLTRLQCGAVGFDHVVAQSRAQSLRSEPVGVELARAGVGGDFFVHQRLGERGRVLLVVAEFAKAHDIDHDVHAEFHAVFQRPLHGQDHGLGVVAVDV